MLQAIDLACQRGERLLFRALAFTLGPGECLHVAGENGAGKTSLLRLLAGLLVPAAGRIEWDGRDIRRLHEEFWSTLAYVGHANGVKDELTAVENLRFGNAIAGRPADDAAARAALGLLGLQDHAIGRCARCPRDSGVASRSPGSPAPRVRACGSSTNHSPRWTRAASRCCANWSPGNCGAAAASC